MKRLQQGPDSGPNQIIINIVSRSPLVDSLDSVGGIRATVHVAVMAAARALREPDAYNKGDSLVKDCAMRRLREDLPYLLLALGSCSPEGAEARGEAVEGLRIIRNEPGDAHASALASKLLAAIGAESGDTAAAPVPADGDIRKAVLAVEAAEAAIGGAPDHFEESRRKMDRHRAYESVEALLPQMLLCLESGSSGEWALRGLGMLRDRVTPLMRPGAVLSGLVLGRIAESAVKHPQQEPAAASVDLAQ